MQEPAKRAAFLALMPALRGRHQYALRSGKGWQGSCARAADGDKTTPSRKRAYIYMACPHVRAPSGRARATGLNVGLACAFLTARRRCSCAMQLGNHTVTHSSVHHTGCCRADRLGQQPSVSPSLMYFHADLDAGAANRQAARLTRDGGKMGMRST